MFQNSNNTGLRPGLEFPAVPYIATDFHCERSLNSWTDGFILNNGWLSGLTDLDTESDYVRERIAAYFTDLISIGFSGFRIDAAKHIYPKPLAAILNKFKANLGGGDLPADFITWLEVIIGGEKDLLMCSDNDYSFGQPFVKFMQQAGLSDSDIGKVKIWSSDYPKEFPICGNWVIPSERLAVQNDCHDD
jgi:alpha-amylase